MIHSDVTTDTISVDSLDCTLSSTVSTTPQITMATNTATHIVYNQNSVAIETENCAITMTTTPHALIDASVDLKEENVNKIETIVDEKQEKLVFKPVSGDGVGVNAWCGGVVSVLDSHDVVIAEEEKKIENDITSKSNFEKLPPFIFYTNIFSTCAHTHTAQEQCLDFPYFHRLHDDVVDELTGRCNDWKMKNESLQTSMDQREEEEEDNDREKRHIDDGGCRCTVCVGVGLSACTAAAKRIWSDIIQWNLSLSL